MLNDEHNLSSFLEKLSLLRQPVNADFRAVCFFNLRRWEVIMARGSKAKYSSKQKRQAKHIEEGYEKKGVAKKEAKRRAWATVNKETGGGKKSGSGRGKKVRRASAKKSPSKAKTTRRTTSKRKTSSRANKRA